jgi:hypothetical protein
VVYSLSLLHGYFVLKAQRPLYAKVPLAYALKMTGLRVKVPKNSGRWWSSSVFAAVFIVYIQASLYLLQLLNRSAERCMIRNSKFLGYEGIDIDARSVLV